jgi:hypothetical protein
MALAGDLNCQQGVRNFRYPLALAHFAHPLCHRCTRYPIRFAMQHRLHRTGPLIDACENGQGLDTIDLGPGWRDSSILSGLCNSFFEKDGTLCTVHCGPIFMQPQRAQCFVHASMSRRQGGPAQICPFKAHRYSTSFTTTKVPKVCTCRLWMILALHPHLPIHVNTRVPCHHGMPNPLLWLLWPSDTLVTLIGPLSIQSHLVHVMFSDPR